MCLAIYKPRGVQIAKRYLFNGFTNNDDGAGFAVATRDKKLEVHKGFLTFESFWATYRKYQHEQAIIHFRWATHGDVTDQNCHPFEMCKGQIAMVHNGVLQVHIPDDQKHKSDTRIYCETILEPLYYRVPVDHPSLIKLLETAIGAHNKLVLLAADGRHAIVNEEAGNWHRGAWFSSHSYSYETSYSGFGYRPRESVYGDGGYKEWWQRAYGMNDQGRDTVPETFETGRYYKNGVEYYVGSNTPTGHIKATASDDAWSDYQEADRRPPILLTDAPGVAAQMSDEELGILSTDDLCDCGSYKVMAVGDHIICAHCGLDRPAAQLIDCSDAATADDEEVACQQWEADQRRDHDIDTTGTNVVKFTDNGE
jgi:predicted glutamine amidotransferase